MKELESRFQEILEPILGRFGAFLVGIDIRSERGRKVVQAFVDTDTGITINQCADISRELSREMSLQELIQGDYRLEISSPGLDRPLKLLRQYPKNVGRKFRVRYRRGDEQQSMTGTLVGVEADVLKFESERGEVVELHFASIVESKEELPW
ncbi:MAG TPA: ribosome maturation factor RimP [Bacteroidota bacterium]|nr:ribosome maturation factor RimP [Bacteroidota bacterium]